LGAAQGQEVDPGGAELRARRTGLQRPDRNSRRVFISSRSLDLSASTAAVGSRVGSRLANRNDNRSPGTHRAASVPDSQCAAGALPPRTAAGGCGVTPTVVAIIVSRRNACRHFLSNGTAKLWQISPASLKYTFAQNDGVVAVDFSKDGTKFATSAGSQGKTVRIWSTAEQLLVELQTAGDVSVVSFNQSGANLLTAGYEDVRLWDIGTKRVISSFKHYGRWVFCARFHPSERYILSGGANDDAVLWEATSGQELTRLKTYDGGSVYDVAFDPRGGQVAVFKNGAAFVFNPGTAVSLHEYHHSRTDSITSGKFSPDGTLILTGGYDSTAKIWETDTAQLISTCIHAKRVRHVEFNGTGTRFVTACADWTARLWDVKGNLIRTFVHGGADVYRARFNNDDSQILTAGWDGTAALWDAQI
jgi:WD40 repeat protein